MESQKVAIIGAGGLGREVLDIFDAINERNPRYEVVGFVVDPQFGKPGTMVNGLPIVGGFDWLAAHSSEVACVCGVGESHVRYRLIQRASSVGARYCSIEHPTVVRSRWVSIGVGSVISAGCVLTNQIRIGNHVHINLACTLGHDAVLE